MRGWSGRSATTPLIRLMRLMRLMRVEVEWDECAFTLLPSLSSFHSPPLTLLLVLAQGRWLRHADKGGGLGMATREVA